MTHIPHLVNCYCLQALCEPIRKSKVTESIIFKNRSMGDTGIHRGKRTIKFGEQYKRVQGAMTLQTEGSRLCLEGGGGGESA